MRVLRGKKKQPLRLQTWITLMVCFVLIVALTVTGILIGRNTAENAREAQEAKIMNIAETVSRAPAVIQGLETTTQKNTIQSYTQSVQENTHVHYIVVMDMSHIRQSHPVEERIGQYFVGGDEDRAFEGERYTSVAEGTLGESLRAFVPITNDNNEQVGVVSVGILLERVESIVLTQQKMVYTGTAAGLFTGIIAAVFLARRVKKTLFGLEPNEIAQLLQEREAMLASVREGVIAVDDTGKIVVSNDAANQLFQEAGLAVDPIGQDAASFLKSSKLTDVLHHQQAEYDQEQVLNGMVFVVNRVPVMAKGRVVGALATFRDKSELTSLVEQLSGAKYYAESLREKTHEFMNKLHVMSAMVHTEAYDELQAYIKQISNNYQKEVGMVSKLIKDPVLAGFLLHKCNRLEEGGVDVSVTGEYPLPLLKNTEKVDAVITVLGNVIENAYEAVANQQKKKVDISIAYIHGIFHFTVTDNGPGMNQSEQETLFQKGGSTKGEYRGIGLYLTKKALDELKGDIKVDSIAGRGTAIEVIIPYEGDKHD
ncbi:two-component system, CitB family, sensor histidine kinase MalK [Alteribacillus persepolensis]|uniref:histidine kinase n=1 Tax=Alteribacillus persepolensis TaxID=568899 RepID=A0A1G8AA06_9BACI|nr:DcuS/MalK family sensor histidine kinase [Alteribacillus persepolensis]SDH17707.1 two-component system, CitB family, sensor histidine kinase MalK [Alteribacillus persepolensis]